MKILTLDLETTGLDTSRDRVVELAYVLEDDQTGQRESFEALVNPGVPIPKESSDIHGIDDEKVKNEPALSEHLGKLAADLDRCDIIAGYNVAFDLKVLMAEGRRFAMPLELHSKEIWDMQKIFFHHEPRTLSAAVRFYCQRELDGAHRALADVEATADVFKAQRERYGIDFSNDEARSYATLSLPLDSNGAFLMGEKGISFSFGKFKGKFANPEAQEIKNYLSWMIGANFPPDTKAIARAILKGKAITREDLETIIREHST